MTPAPPPPRGIDPEAAAQGEPSAAWKAANIRPPKGGPVAQVEGVVREGRRAGVAVVLALCLLALIIVGGIAVYRWGPPTVSSASAASAKDVEQDRKLEDLSSIVAELKTANVNTSAAVVRLTVLMEDVRPTVKGLEDRLRAVEVKVGGK